MIILEGTGPHSIPPGWDDMIARAMKVRKENTMTLEEADAILENYRKRQSQVKESTKEQSAHTPMHSRENFSAWKHAEKKRDL